MGAGQTTSRVARTLWLTANWSSAIGLGAVAFAAGFAVHWGLSAARPPAGKIAAATTRPGASRETAQQWTCSMHPSVRKPGPGTCPICKMDLIPLENASSGPVDPRRLALSKAAAALMRVETVPVERRYVTAEVRMVGKVDYDETRLAYLTAWMPGRLDRLFADYVGMPIGKGDHMVEIYSPDLLAAQEEFLQAREATRGLRSGDSALLRESVRAAFEAAREKLRLLGLTDAQVEALAARGKATDRLTIYAPAGGIIVAMAARQGMYVKTGQRLFTIADLSHVWVRLDAYEQDLGWLRYGQTAELTTESLPGRTFTGRVSFLDPVLNEPTRTVRVRVNAPNGDGALKPGMFVRAVVRSNVAAGGRVMAPSLAGKWISPMHPEVVKDAPGKCDVCGMPLVRAEELGYAAVDPNDTPPPLVVPASAVLRTGKRAIAYVALPDRDRPTFEMRQVTLGQRAGEHFLVRSGLEEGERVVVRGNFKIDSERQIRGLPSMMAPEGGGPAGHAHHGGARPPKPKPPPAAAPVPPAFRAGLAKLVAAYVNVSDSLANDDANTTFASFRRALAALPSNTLAPAARAAWHAHAKALTRTLDEADVPGGIEVFRADFALISEQMQAVLRRYGAPQRTVYVLRCPMAFNNRGANWLQFDQDVRNPYFGAAMFECGAVIQTFRPPTALTPAHEH